MTIKQETLISVQNLQKYFKGDQIKALDGISTEIKKGEVVVVIGPSGSGKSTFLRCLNLLELPTGGQIFFEGTDITDPKSNINLHRQKMGMVFQHFNLFPNMTVLRNMTLAPIKLLKKTKEEAEEKAMELLRRVGLEDRANAYPSQLSGGQKQRIAIVRALCMEPQVMLFDEPTSALDLHHQIEVMELIRQLNEKEHITVLAVLHDINLASRFCSRIVILKDGKVKADGTPREIINRQEMEELYEMRLLVKNNPLIEKPEIIPIRVMDEKQTAKPLRIHVICGEKGGVRILEQLTNMGHAVTAGVVNRESDDAEICEYLDIPRVEIGSFQTVGQEEQAKNLELMKDADAVIVADIPFGEANIRNLDGLEHVKGELYIHKNILNQDFTHGQLQRRLDEIQKIKEIHFYEKFNAGDWL